MPWADKRDENKYRGGYRDRRGKTRYVRNQETGRIEIYASQKLARNAAAVAENAAWNTPAHRDTVVRRGERMTFAQWWPLYNNENRKRSGSRKPVAIGTRKNDDSVYHTHLAPWWDEWRLADITRDDVQEWIEALEATPVSHGPRRGEPIKASVVRRVFAVFSAAMSAAVVNGPRLPYTPCFRIELPAVEQPDERFLTVDEQARLINNAPTDHGRMFADLGLATGMRAGELTGLHRHRITLDGTNPHVLIRETHDEHVSDIKDTPKSGKLRSVPLPASTVAALRDYMRDHPAVPCATPHRDGSTCGGALLFADADGCAWANWWCRERMWLPTIAAAGLDGLRRHDMRHTFASTLVQDGTDLYKVQRLLGHSSIRVTERYAHLGESHWAAVVDTLDAVRRTVPTEPTPPTDPAPADEVNEAREAVSVAVSGESAPYLLPRGGDDEGAMIIPFTRPRRSQR